MAKTKGTLKICPNGHKFYKSSDCPICPTCEAARNPASAFLALMAGPARRALENEGITTLKKLAKYSERDLLKLHGFGPASLPILRKALKESELNFKDS